MQVQIEIEKIGGERPRSRLRDAPIQPIVAPLWLGAERPGVDLGGALLAERLTGNPALDHRLRQPIILHAPEPLDARDRLHRGTLAFLPEIATTCRALRDAVARSIAAGELALTLGGDHATAIGSIAGSVAAGRRVGVLWFDSHLDLNTPATSPSGHVHGMAVAVALGMGPQALVEIGCPGIATRDIRYFGARDIDAGEQTTVDRFGIDVVTMAEWRTRGIASSVERAVEELLTSGVEAFHISFDVDVLDPSIMPGTGTPVPDGLSLSDAETLMTALGKLDAPILAVDWVELNPLLDVIGSSNHVAERLLSMMLA